MRFLFTLAIFLSSALLFLVEPMVARIILPAYGGTAAVWTASVLFFQVALLAGYGYTHLSVRYLGVRRQPWVHLGLMALVILTLPFAAHVSGGATGAHTPVFRLLWQLAVLVGAAFLIVSAGAPLIQRWFADTRDPHAHDPYFLYAASNLGSMVALLAYPVFVEPRLGLSNQARLWATGYIGLFAGMALCALILAFSSRRDSAGDAPPPPPEMLPEIEGRDDGPPVDGRRRAEWVCLAAIPSSLLLGVTAYISTNIAPIPLLWVAPLALYLLSFILAFKRRPLLSSRPLGRIVGILVPAVMVAVIMEAFMPVLSFFHLLVFFAVAWMCHARLCEVRPSASRLTEFYFWVSLGGVVGGFFNALVAPFIFTTLFEYPLALAAAGLFIPPYRAGTTPGRTDWLYPIVLTFSTGVIIVLAKLYMPPSQWRTGIAVGIPAVLCYLAVDRPLRFALSLSGVVLVSNGLAIAAEGRILLSERSFYGVHRVTVFGPPGDPTRFHMLTHGNTKHGLQNEHFPARPLMYYYPDSPIGYIFAKLIGERRSANVGLVGLGVGSLAAYGHLGQHFTFYEIDPTVRALATDPKLFTYIGDSIRRGTAVHIELGDGRLELAEAPDGRLDLIVLDAFSSDAIPIHLLTREAAAMYIRKLAPGGLLAYHISNRYLDLSGVVAAIGRDLGLTSYIADYAPTPEELDQGAMPCSWMVLARRPADAKPILGKGSDWEARPAEPHDRAWTDDYSDVLGVLKMENL